MSVTKRFFFYLLSLVTLGMFAFGAGTLIGLLFDTLIKTSPTQIGGRGFSGQTLSLGLALLVIGGLLWYLFWKSVQKAASGNIEETGSAIRKWYLNIIVFASLSAAIPTATELLTWLLGGLPSLQFSSSSIAIPVVAMLIWFYHRRVEEKEGQTTPVARTLKRWYIYIYSAWGIGWLSASIVQLVCHGVFSLPVWGTTVTSGFWDFPVRQNIAGIVLGGLIWWFHWFKMAKSDNESTLRQVYLYLFTIMGSVLAGLTALVTFLDRLFRFAFGNVPSPSGAYFQFLGWTIPLMLVAVAIWIYHRKVIQEETSATPRMRFSAKHIYSYLMSLIGLGALIAGLIVLFGVLLDLLKNALSAASIVAGPGIWRDQLSLSLALLLVATPMWLFYWNNVIKMVSAGGLEERSARTRRIYLYLLIAAAIITLAADLINIIYRVLSGLIQGQFGVNVLKQTMWSIESLIVAVPVLLYHWKILRRDQMLGAEAAPVLKKKSVTVLVPDEIAGVATTLEEKLGYKVRILRNLGQATVVVSPSSKEIDSVINEIRSVPGNKVMVVFDERGWQVIPYEEK